MRKIITLNEWVERFPTINTIFDKVSADLKLFTVFTSAEMFSYFVNKFGERGFICIMMAKMPQIILIG